MASGSWQLYSWVQVSRWFATAMGFADEVSAYDRTIAAADHLVRARAILAEAADAALLTRLVA
ncbi:MAG: hypothetical protein L0H64_02190 [Pseudonocardia sp.]|nr:hypothetical protein [Pseudonocardia sp.]